MINLLVDEAYAFDYLSILHVKKKINQQVESSWKECFDYIKNQIGENMMQEIIDSKEYHEMINANQITFDAVEKARYDSITAKEVDKANMLRYNKKCELQKKYFNTKIKEFKS
jgi:hypothetical protein